MSKLAKEEQSELFNNYLAQQEPQFKQYLIDIRNLIKSIVPEAEETFSYHVHCFRYIYMLVGIGANKKFCSLYTMSTHLVKNMKNDLAGCKISGTTLHFKPGEPLPVDIIIKIVLGRKQENEIMELARKMKKKVTF
jgi:uncharacterized protein YdhG (YjbR/CyaY superfamily)